jgi:hypothetical protein
MPLSGPVFRLLTAPGVIIHEIAHHLVCIIYRIEVIEASYFQLTGYLGYVKHRTPKSFFINALIALAPLVINASIATTLIYISIVYVSGTSIFAKAIGIGGVWIGWASYIHMLPSSTDIGNLWTETTRHSYRYPFAVIVAPVYALRLLTTKLRLDVLMIPLATAAVRAIAVTHLIAPYSALECFLTTNEWGCWETTPVLETAIVSLTERVVEIIILAVIQLLNWVADFLPTLLTHR